MKFLVCEVSQEQEEYGGAEGCFEAKDGTLFNYEIEADQDTIRITDSIGRMVPIGIEKLPTILLTLNRLNNYYTSVEKLNDFLFQKLVQGYTQE